ncbi:M48 family metalloprotease [Aestuariivirga sp.]|uniref:M48 family metalloprotease n=1 Tax=Aestuariivirga sp. TaxID=2650926 RepID=UPI0039E297B5
MRWLQRAAALLAAVNLILTTAVFTPAQAQQQRQGPNLIRDAEIEGLLRNFSRPIFKAAGINAGAVKVYVIADDSINAFVAGGQRIFIHTGLITKAKTPSEIIGVIAHESGHIAGGHLARLNNEMAQASAERIIGMLIGAAAVVGGAAAGVQGAGQAGASIMAGSGGIAQRNLLSYQRSMESAADQAALKYLLAIQESPAGMLSLFQKLMNDSLASLDRADPYLFSHPMPLDRIRTLEAEAKKSPYYDKADDPGLVLRLSLAKAKLSGFMDPPQRVFQRYPTTDMSLAGRYARAIAMFRRGDIKNSMPIIDSLTRDLPANPYFWELKAQAYMENGQAANGIPAIKKARELLPNNGLLTQLHAAILLSTEDASRADEALSLLRLAKKTEPDMPQIYKDMARAYGLKGDAARADLATAEFYYAAGDRDLALKKAKLAQQRFAKGTPEWLRANDLVTFAAAKK